MKLAIASDHAGFQLKSHLLEVLLDLGHDVQDLGPSSTARVDYPDFAHSLSEKVASGDVERGVLVCGSGIGVSIAANRHAGVRAVNAVLEVHAEFSRRHNDANVICLGERFVGAGLAERLVEVFLSTSFEGGRHSARVEKIDR